MRYLINTTITYRVHTIEDAEALHEDLKSDGRFECVAFSRTTKYVKEKGEITDSYEVCKAKLVFTDEKKPVATYDIDFTERF
jgi:hypothetical protein